MIGETIFIFKETHFSFNCQFSPLAEASDHLNLTNPHTMAFSKRLLFLTLFTTNLSLIVAQVQPGTCPGDNGKTRVTAGTYKQEPNSPTQTNKRSNIAGPSFTINCDKGEAPSVEVLSRGYRPNFGVCIDVCGNTAGCAALDFDPNTKSCIFYKTATVSSKDSLDSTLLNRYLTERNSLYSRKA